MIAQYIGTPYDIHNKNGLNCWGLITTVYRDLFSDTIKDFPSGTDTPQELAAVFALAFAKNEHGFTITEKPKDFDLVVFSRSSTAGTLYHCGIMYEGKVLHSNKNTGGVVYQSLKDAKRGFREQLFWQR